jgi:hypothetical protein
VGNFASQKEVDAIRMKSTKSRQFLVEGFSNQRRAPLLTRALRSQIASKQGDLFIKQPAIDAPIGGPGTSR